jgi:hypothetical protein
MFGLLRRILALLEEILRLLLADTAAVATVFQFGSGDNLVNFQLNAKQKAPYTITEVDANGNPVAPSKGDAVSITVSTSDLTVVPDATPVAGAVASGFIVGNPASAGATGVQVTETTTLANGTVLPAVTNLVDVIAAVAPAAVATTFVFGAPVAQ